MAALGSEGSLEVSQRHRYPHGLRMNGLVLASELILTGRRGCAE
jgi:hypothetical protein